MWRETSGGDYDVGEQYLCIACNHGFYLPVGVQNELNDEQGRQRLEALKTTPSHATL